MKVPVTWLTSLLDRPAAPDDLAERLTQAGLECELHAAPSVPDGIVTGRIVSCDKHPNADRLSVCVVDAGDGVERSIVCGAPNVEAGRVGAVALPGTDFGEGFVIVERKLRGQLSQGMLCSERELGLSDAHDGILLWPGDTPVGRPVAEILGGEATLETFPFSNRGDLMSVAGVAREVSALDRRRWEPARPRVPDVKATGEWSVRIEDPADCPRYAGRLIEGLVAGPSPPWMAERLQAAGVRPLLNLVDVTNYVLLERGHPLHAFDVAKLAGREIGVRRARAGERLTTLDGKERDLSPSVLMITDGSGPVAIAGIMGGESTMVSESTTSVFLEGASFEAPVVRAGARGLRLPTDASARFERGVDPAGVADALDRATELLLQLCPGARLVDAVDAYPAPASPVGIRLRRRTLARVLGADLAPEGVTAVLHGLGLDVKAEVDAWDVRAPTFRRDLVAEEDLVEEVGRIFGYDELPERVQVRAVADRAPEPRTEALWRSRRILLGCGLDEVVTPSLVDGKREAALGTEDRLIREPVALRNPLTSDRNALRGSLVPSLLQVLATNRARATSDLAIFEVGRAFGARPDGGVDERLRSGLLLSGRGLHGSGVMGANSCDFFDMKGLVEVYVEQFWGAPPVWSEGAPEPWGTARAATVSIGDHVIGFVGEPAAKVRASFDLPAELPVLLAELDLEQAAVSPADVRFEPLPRFPAVLRDLAFVASRDRRNAELLEAIRESGGEWLVEVRLFDLYEGPPLGEDEKSLAYTLVFRSADRSLTNDEVEPVVTRVIEHLEKTVGARIR